MKYVAGLLIAVLFTGCEGYRRFLLFNKTGQTITVETKPELFTPQFKSATDSFEVRLPSRTYSVLPDSTLLLLAGFGPANISANRLTINYLKIMTPTDTLVADSKSDILRLVRNGPTKFKRCVDKADYSGNRLNVKAIFVRQ